jgi:hypothetical protein
VCAVRARGEGGYAERAVSRDAACYIHVLSQMLGERAAVQCPLPQLAVESRWPGWRRLCNAATPVRSTVNLLLGWNQQFLQLGVF